ncbi:hypothetical protein BDY17DRAFT_307437 [Neohortaea acidophila]|uniref:Uncharacterized protein n=1 Tax=Neohortaea acidophila TaxID=245834 RepID=A0A6A6Q710_9PEZI|nr:uncharacterized protein BDY17DRAFT_307437 [Neohortaea acidophila]KAF2488170.1 hypothetical protein BDY17DRAFT_307437 [Neohortaea acidophila]
MEGFCSFGFLVGANLATSENEPEKDSLVRNMRCCCCGVRFLFSRCRTQAFKYNTISLRDTSRSTIKHKPTLLHPSQIQDFTASPTPWQQLQSPLCKHSRGLCHSPPSHHRPTPHSRNHRSRSAAAEELKAHPSYALFDIDDTHLSFEKKRNFWTTRARLVTAAGPTDMEPIIKFAKLPEFAWFTHEGYKEYCWDLLSGSQQRLRLRRAAAAPIATSPGHIQLCECGQSFFCATLDEVRSETCWKFFVMQTKRELYAGFASRGTKRRADAAEDDNDAPPAKRRRTSTK